MNEDLTNDMERHIRRRVVFSIIFISVCFITIGLFVYASMIAG